MNATSLNYWTREAGREMQLACIMRLARSNALTPTEWAKYGPQIIQVQCQELGQQTDALVRTVARVAAGTEAA